MLPSPMNPISTVSVCPNWRGRLEGRRWELAPQADHQIVLRTTRGRSRSGPRPAGQRRSRTYGGGAAQGSPASGRTPARLTTREDERRVCADDHLDAEPGQLLDLGVKLGLVNHGDPRAQRVVVDHRHPSFPHERWHLVDPVNRLGRHRCAEGIGCVVDTRFGIEKAAGIWARRHRGANSSKGAIPHIQKVSPSSIVRMRSRGIPNQVHSRPDAAQVMTAVALGHNSIASAKISDVGSSSRCVAKIQRTSFGSTSENMSSNQMSWLMTMPVSTMTGSAARITSELKLVDSEPPRENWTARIRKVSGATSSGPW